MGFIPNIPHNRLLEKEYYHLIFPHNKALGIMNCKTGILKCDKDNFKNYENKDDHSSLLVRDKSLPEMF